MTKADIAERMKANTDLTLKDTADMLELVLSIDNSAMQ